jgi:hypothetical protein
VQDWVSWGLSDRQSVFLERTLPGAEIVVDLSWPLSVNRVLEVRCDARSYIVKAGGTNNHHIPREIRAHASWTDELAAARLASPLVAADGAANALVLERLDGVLVQGTDAEHRWDVHAQAGRLLGRFHHQHDERSETYEANETAKALAALGSAHRIDAGSAARARDVLHRHRPGPVLLVPTHGDWQPRNWLIDRGTVRIIDFGRFGFRPASADFVRLQARQWQRRPELATAFLEGYGADPREEDQWRISLLRDAIGTAVWAFRVGDQQFEAEGLRSLVAALTLFD